MLCLTLICPAIAGAAPKVPPGFVVETLAEGLQAATFIVSLADGRILIGDQTGKVLVWKDGGVLEKPALELAVDDYWERGVIGCAVHPEFPRVPEVFVCYVKKEPFSHHVVSKFSMAGDVIDPASEVVLLEGDDQEKTGGFKKAGHQGGVIRFGADGMLYIGLGEQTAGKPSQDVKLLQGKLLRIAPDGSVPEDNPLLGKTEGKYRAIYATGVRNPYGLALQPAADGGRMWWTDVGASGFEEINAVVAGANYGWPEAEGMAKGDAKKKGYTDPLHAYPPALGRSICGGAFYPTRSEDGAVYPAEWRGKFFFVDFVNHWVKAIDPAEPEKAVTFGTGFQQPIAVEVGADGSLLVLNRGTVWRDPKKFKDNAGSLVRVAYTGVVAEGSGEKRPPGALGVPGYVGGMPEKLSELEVFGLVTGGEVEGRVRNYWLNSPAWEPGVEVQRWFALEEGKVLGFREKGEWEVPEGTVVVKHYTRGGKALETRVVVAGGCGVSYRWEGEDAVLLQEPVIEDVGDGFVWWFQGPEAVLGTNLISDAYAMDLNTRQLSRSWDGKANPVAVWGREGLVEGVGGLERVAVMAGADQPASLEVRVRSYLDANCALCHRPGGASRGLFDARFETPLAEAGIVNGDLAVGDLGIAGAKVVVPGEPEKSVLWLRLKDRGLLKMPPVQFHGEVSPLVPLMEAWIREMGEEVTSDQVTK